MAHFKTFNTSAYIYSPWVQQPLQFYTAKHALEKADGIIWKDFQFDLIHAHTSYLDGRLGAYLSKKYKAPLVITEHTGPFNILTQNPLIKFHTVKAINSASKLICVSKALAKQVSFQTKYDFKKIFIVPNGYNSSIFHPTDKIQNTDHLIRLLYVGALEPGKNPFMLIKAFEIVAQKVSFIELFFVGDGSLRIDLQEYIYSHQLECQVFLLGSQKRDKVSEIMRNQCDIFILPSNGETFGCVIIEALASGKPVIATRCGGPEEIVINDSLGCLCPIGDSLELANSILAVIDRLTLYDAKFISQYAYENFRYQIIAKKINDVYQSLI